MSNLSGACSGDPCKSTDTTIAEAVIAGNRHYGLVIAGNTEFSKTYKVVITYQIKHPLP
jgi:hypothetical protein